MDTKLDNTKLDKKLTLQYVHDCIDSEGFDYGIRYYSDFSEVDDLEFHRLRAAYLNAATDLEDYLNCPDDCD